MMSRKITFEESRASEYFKTTEVLAFKTQDPIRFKKSWGDQLMRTNSWVIIPLSNSGDPTTDIYGCDGQVFLETYSESLTQKPNQYFKNIPVRAYQPGYPFTVDTVLDDGHIETISAESKKYDDWLVRAPDGETYSLNHDEFRRTYKEVHDGLESYKVKTRDEHWSADSGPKRILALDGGGVRGVLTLGYLKKIESILRERHGNLDSFRLCHYFDLIAGTSTGAIIAACLARGMTVDEVITLYESLADRVFKRHIFRRGLIRARYSSKILEEILNEYFAQNNLGDRSLQTGLLVVAKRMDTGSVWPMSNNPQNPFFSAGLGDTFLSNEDYPLARVLRASTAAPSFFSPEHIEISKEADRPHGEFVDGGVSPHNNPALLALQLATVKGFGAGWDLDPANLFVLSVGTGSTTPGVSASRLAGKHAIKSLLSLMDDCSELVETMLQWISDSPTARKIDVAINDLKQDAIAGNPLIHYVRYNVQFEEEWLKNNLALTWSRDELAKLSEMDRPQSIPRLRDLGAKAAEIQVSRDHFPSHYDLS